MPLARNSINLPTGFYLVRNSKHQGKMVPKSALFLINCELGLFPNRQDGLSRKADSKRPSGFLHMFTHRATRMMPWSMSSLTKFNRLSRSRSSSKVIAGLNSGQPRVTVTVQSFLFPSAFSPNGLAMESFHISCHRLV